MLAWLGIGLAYALIVAGATLWAVPAGFIVAGALLAVIAGLFVDVKPKKEPSR